MLMIAPSMLTEPPVGVQVPPILARQPACASTAAERTAPNMACVLAARACVCMAMKRGRATAARMPTMAITTTSSIRVKPLPDLPNPEACICSDSRAPCAHSKPTIRLRQFQAGPLRRRGAAHTLDQLHPPGHTHAALFVGGEISP